MSPKPEDTASASVCNALAGRLPGTPRVRSRTAPGSRQRAFLRRLAALFRAVFRAVCAPRAFFASLSRAAPAGIVLATALLPASAPAQQPWETRDPYTITSVAVDQRALDELAAKQQAIRTGQRQALETLLNRITLVANRDRLPAIDAEVIRATVRDFAVDSEKYGGGRYIASLTVRFHRKAVRDWLRRAGIPFSETVSKPILVLPVWRSAGATLLWDASNPWLAAWHNLPKNDAMLSLLVPAGNFADIGIINARQALTGAVAPLAAIARKYRVQQVLVVRADHKRGLRGRPDSVSVAILRHGHGADDEIPPWETSVDSGLMPTLHALAAALSDRMADDWKQRTLLTLGEESSILLRIPLGSLSAWVSLRGQLEALPPVVGLVVESLSTSEARVRLRHAGGLAALKQAMIQRGITITADADTGAYILRNRPWEERKEGRAGRLAKAQG